MLPLLMQITKIPAQALWRVVLSASPPPCQDLPPRRDPSSSTEPADAVKATITYPARPCRCGPWMMKKHIKDTI